MSLIEDKLLAEKLKAVEAAQKELNEEKTAYYSVLGEWLENALLDDNNEDLKALFIKQANDVKNKNKDNYLKRISDRKIAKKIADNLVAVNKVKSSNHTDNMVKEKTDNGNINNPNSHQNNSLI